MVSLITKNKAQKRIARNMRDLRLGKELTQKGLAERSGVSLSSLRKFEQKGIISLESFLKLALTLGCMDKLITATEPMENNFSSIDDVLAKDDKKPKRGKHG
ncbi:MAG: helix-turn-helix transcriptional regulator [Muricauda sp.]|nr:helix-turn-helix transcriptional regulator [Allomuricauda sp.]